MTDTIGPIPERGIPLTMNEVKEVLKLHKRHMDPYHRWIMTELAAEVDRLKATLKEVRLINEDLEINRIINQSIGEP